MARITVEDCLSKAGNENRFDLVHLAIKRLKQHRQGQAYLVKGKNKEVVMTLREIASKKVTFDNINELGKVELLFNAAKNNRVATSVEEEPEESQQASSEE